MSGIFRKVIAKDRLPKKDGHYDTNIGRCGYWANVKHWYLYNVQWWLEEIELPSDEEIEKIANDSGAYRVEAGWFIEGFKVAIKGGTK